MDKYTEMQTEGKRVRELTLEEVEDIGPEEPVAQQTQVKQLKKCCLRQGCEDINLYRRLNKIHEGNYGVVYRALEQPSGSICAIKKLKLVQGKDFPITSLREISILRSLDHPNIIKISRVAGSASRDRVYIVMQYLDHELKELLTEVRFKQTEVRRLLKDLLEGIAYLHERKIIHRDLKTSNLLYSNTGILKICDFGLARKASQALMTQQVITMWYRPPELLLGEYQYSVELDMWSVGIILAEIVLREPPFKGKTELEQLDAIFRAIGSPEDSWPEAKMMKNFIFIQGRKHQHDDRLAEMIPKGEYGLSPEGVDLLKLLLTINPKKRITAKKALQHPWFKDTICLREDMLRHNPINEIERVKKRLKPNEQ